MQTYELGYTIAPGAGPLVAVTLAAPTAQICLLEFGVCIKAVTSLGNAVFGRPAANGTGSAGTALQALNPAGAGATSRLVPGAFTTTQPTAPTNPMREFTWPLAGGAGAGVSWGWEQGEFLIPSGGQVVLWCVTGTATFGGYFKVSEGG